MKGIYFLHNKDRIVYVGMSNDNVMERIVSHRKDKEFDSFTVMDNGKLTTEQLLRKEKRLIKQYKPKYNIVHNPKKKQRRKATVFRG